ncbi:MAG: MFS transporter [Nevskia sp.]|nr:MFS transporter [Nevskia sp.]
MRPAGLLPITLIVFVDVLGFTIVIPLLPLYAEQFGASAAVVGLLVGTYAVCALLSAPLLGRWSDRVGRKPVLLVSQLGTLAGFVMLALAPSLAWLFAGRALDGATAANVATARAYIADVTPPKQRTAAFGLIAAAFGFGYLVGPGIAGVLARYGHTVPLWAAAGVSAFSILATLILLPAAPAPAAPRGMVERLPVTPALRLRLWQTFAFFTAFSCFTSGFALFCERRLRVHGQPYGASEVALVLAYVGALALLMQLVILPRLVRRLGEPRLVALGLAATALAYAAIGFAHSLPALLSALTFSAAGNSVLRPSLFGLTSMQVPPNRQGALSGLIQSLQSLGMILGPLVAGSLIEFGWLHGWALACSAMLAAALLSVRWSGRFEFAAGRTELPAS